jgi:hypothetical protein
MVALRDENAGKVLVRKAGAGPDAAPRAIRQSHRSVTNGDHPPAATAAGHATGTGSP